MGKLVDLARRRTKRGQAPSPLLPLPPFFPFILPFPPPPFPPFPPLPPPPHSVCSSTPSCQIQFHISDWLYFGRTATMVKDSNQQILHHSRGLTSPLTNPALA